MPFSSVRAAQEENGIYIEHGTFAREAQADSPLLPGLAIDIGALFDAGRA